MPDLQRSDMRHIR